MGHTTPHSLQTSEETQHELSSDGTLPFDYKALFTPAELASLSEEQIKYFSTLTVAQAAKLVLLGVQQARQRRAAYRAEWGEDPPYVGDGWEHYRDNHGKVRRHYVNSASVQAYEIRIGFAPTLAEYEYYKDLKAQLRKTGDSEERKRIRNDIQQLVDSTQGEIPDKIHTLYSGNQHTAEERLQETRKAMRALFREFGLEHIFEEPYPRW